MAKKQKKQSLLKKITLRISGVFLISACIFAWLSCLFYNHSDNAINIVSDAPIKNYLGVCGAITADYILSGFGFIVPIFLLPILRWGLDLSRGFGFIHGYSRSLSFLLGLISGSISFALLPIKLIYLKAGGFIGTFFASHIMSIINNFNTYGYGKHIAFSVLFLLTILFFDYAMGITLKDWFKLTKSITTYIYLFIRSVYKLLHSFCSLFSRHHYSSEERNTIKKTAKANKKAPKEKIEPSFANEEKNTAKTKEKQKHSDKKTTIAKQIEKPTDGYVCPSINLLSRPKDKTNNSLSKEELSKIAIELENTLQEFGVNGKIVKVRPGPVVTLYELEPAPGTKSARVIGLADDIARSMSAAAVRIAVVPGSNTIGIELPNSIRDTVWLRDLFEDSNFVNSKNELNVVLGKDIGGQNVYADLSKMPHLLVAGTTGSGKSVGVNSMILSLLFRMSPEECKLIMIDPKMLEFSMYNGIPHLPFL